VVFGFIECKIKLKLKFRSNNQHDNIGLFKTLMVMRLVTKREYEPEASVRGSYKICV